MAAVKKSTGAEPPTLKTLAEHAIAGEYDAVLNGLCARQDARVAALFMRAVATVDFVTDSPKASGWLAESHGAMEAGEIPDDSDVLVKALLETAILHRTTQKNDGAIAASAREMGLKYG